MSGERQTEPLLHAGGLSNQPTMPASGTALPASGSRGWDELSRWMLRRTFDLIAVSLIVLAGVTIACRVLVWWDTEPPDVMADPQAAFSGDALAPWGIGPGGAEVQFGNAPFALRRQTLQGPRESALERLLAEGRRELSAARQETVPPGLFVERSAREAQLLKQLAAIQPTEADVAGAWSLYRLEGPLAVVLGVGPQQPAGDAARVVFWGLALPAGEDAWSLLTVSPRRGGSRPRGGDDVALPAGAVLGLALHDELGGRLVTFSGPGPPEAWEQHFDRLAAAEAWRVQRAWGHSDVDRSAAWIGVVDGVARRIDVHLTRGEPGWTGLVSLSPIRPQEQE